MHLPVHLWGAMTDRIRDLKRNYVHKIHYYDRTHIPYSGIAECGRHTSGGLMSNDVTAVTCKKCLDIIVKERM